MKKILKMLLIICIIILIKLLLSFSINEIIILNYNNKIYNSILVKTLYIFNFNESYIAYYNEGNILYQKKKYDKAIKNYYKSIEKKPPQKKICDIRINLSLSMIKNISSTDYKTIYDQLEEAKGNLYKNNCANAINNKGYSQDAEKFEEEIKKMQNELNKESNENQSNEEQKKEEIEEDNSDIEKELKEIEKDSKANRESDLSNYENMDDYSYYSGKKW